MWVLRQSGHHLEQIRPARARAFVRGMRLARVASVASDRDASYRGGRVRTAFLKGDKRFDTHGFGVGLLRLDGEKGRNRSLLTTVQQ